MWTVVQYNLVPIVIALLIGLVTGWWMFRRLRGETKSDARADIAIPAPPARRVATTGGKTLPDEVAVAAKDVAGEILSVGGHLDIPGPDGPPDNLQTLKGVGPKLAAQLHQNGITRFDQLARLSANEVAILDSRMGAFAGRVARDRLVDQASYLARNDKDGFEAKFGKLGEA